MLILTDDSTGKRYRIIAWDVIKKGDIHLVADHDNGTLEIHKAEDDFPDTFGSLILEDLDEVKAEADANNEAFQRGEIR